MFLDEKIVTTVAMLAAMAVVAGMIVLERRKRVDLQPSLIPTTPILLGSGLVAILALVHLLNLYGIHTGR
jgi:hypothetical protein